MRLLRLPHHQSVPVLQRRPRVVLEVLEDGMAEPPELGVAVALPGGGQLGEAGLVQVAEGEMAGEAVLQGHHRAVRFNDQRRDHLAERALRPLSGIILGLACGETRGRSPSPTGED